MTSRLPDILVLFDIDGTLIRSRGKGRIAMLQALSNRFNITATGEFRDFAGSTDRRILRTLFNRAGMAGENLNGSIDLVLKDYLEYLHPLLQPAGAVEVMPGVRPLLTQLEADERFYLGLLTGNIEPGARMKLEPVGLNPFFAFGAFGDDAEDRNELPPIAMKRANRQFNRAFHPQQVWIIGDTTRDIECARVNGLRSIGVATSGFSLKTLSAAEPDLAVSDLSDTRAIVDLMAH